MSSSTYEIVRNLEITKVRAMEIRTDCKLFGKELNDLDQRIKISLNQLPPIYRTEALVALTKASSKINLWASLLDFIVSKQDTSIKELKLKEHMEMTEELKPEEAEMFKTDEPEGKV